jgi:catechol 2,3-dioxygenase-like lactoylglutathione lyase family enzyme
MAGVIDVRAAHRASFTVSDLDRSLRFYRDLLGLEVVVDQTPNASYLSNIVGYPDLRLPGQSDHRHELIQYLNNVGTPVDLSTNRVGSAPMPGRRGHLRGIRGAASARRPFSFRRSGPHHRGCERRRVCRVSGRSGRNLVGVVSAFSTRLTSRHEGTGKAAHRLRRVS